MAASIVTIMRESLKVYPKREIATILSGSGVAHVTTRDTAMTKDELTEWALANGWQMVGGYPSLTKPSAPNVAIVRLVLKTTVASLEIKKPAGKWDKVAHESY